MSRIHRVPIAAGCLTALLLAVGAGSAFGQQPTTTLTVGTEKGAPNEQVFVALTWVPADGEQFRSVELNIRFANSQLSLDEVRNGDALELVEGELKTTEAQDGHDSGVRVLHLVATADRPIPQGVVSYLTFKVLSDATTGQKIDLKGDVQASSQKNGAGAKPARVLDGWVEVTLEPRAFACFFYMH